jgi:hypothetical protein
MANENLSMLYDDEFLSDIDAMLKEFAGLESVGEAVATATYEALLSTITGKTRDEILDMAKERGAALVTRMTDEQKARATEIITRALEEQKGVDSAARQLRDGLKLDTNRAKQLDKYEKELIESGMAESKISDLLDKRKEELIKERARTIATTEMGQAMEDGSLAHEKEQGATHKVWITSQDDKVSDICYENAAAGPIPIDEQFPSGHDAPLGHVGCRCSAAYIVDKGSGELRRAKARMDEHVAEIDAMREANKQTEETGE